MKDSKLAEGGLGKKRDIRLAKKLIKGLQGIDTPAAKEMKALMNEVLAGGYKPVKKKDGGLMEAIEKVKAKKMKEGGDVDKEFPEPKERTAEFRIEMIPKEFRKSFREKFMSGRGETSRKIQEKAKGGEAVPAKFKGFSKLPEAVQEKMNPSLAKKFEVGGPVKMGSGGGVCRGMGAARAGGKFKLR